MPVLRKSPCRWFQPTLDLWLESGRWEQYGRTAFRITDRGDRQFVLGPTHEKVGHGHHP